MAHPIEIKNAYERNREAVRIRPSLGKNTAVTKIRLFDGTTCEVEHKHWKFKVDIGTGEGGNDAGPGPGILERGALGSCLAIAYSQIAAVLEVPIDNIEVHVESDLDARGMLGIDDRPPGFIELRYNVHIESPADEADVQKVIDKADRHSPVLDDFKRAIPVKRNISIVNSKDAKEASS
ncbi:OsmC family protein [Natronogracilivirga saccharolytica]|uniref:OsmC family protein n=1 Tax=Natronogracilivirga saccharolytica TaxID=2812953 RepID=A0A8J7UTZ6_9BACT|nr:OsmC family protein [Natronogracilivirga saccharolytica]MBP3191870.1 OsmC family protein [Natronogracilivirga saccharolytica]